MRLLDGAGVQLATTTTAADGSYTFGGLAAGPYSVEEPVQPVNTVNGITSAGSITGTGTAGTPTAVGVAPSRVSNISLQSAGGNVANSPDNNFGERPATGLATLSGFVWRDNNGDRTRDPGDTPIPNWGVAVSTSAGVLVPCTLGNSTTGCVVMPDGRSLFRTDSNGAYNVTSLTPGAYKVEFRDPANNVVFGTPKNSSNDPASSVATTRDSLNVTLSPGQNMVRQDLPLDPSGVIYDAVTRQPIAGSRVELCGPPGFNPATMLVGGGSYAITGQCASMTTGPNGFYQYLLTPAATPGAYTIGATAPSYSPAPSTLIPPAPGIFTPAGPSPLFVQAQAGPPPVGSPTTYYLSFNLAPGVPDVIHNHIPLDPFSGTGLFLQKQVNRDTVELGDSLQYTLRLTSPNGAVTNAVITDSLPAGFRLMPGTVTVNAAAAPDPAGSPGPVLSFNLGNLAANAIATVTYRVRVGVGAQQGDGINRARANALNAGVPVTSNQARARVRITSGVFFQEACVVGKIYSDCNNNRIQDPEELGIPGVRMYLQDGTYLISDVSGAYSYCGLPARTAVLKVDRSTLPMGSQLVTSSNRNALDANSLFLDLRFGELHRADFIEGSCSPNVIEQIKARRTQGNVVAPSIEKKPQPRLIFESGSIRNAVPKERDDVPRAEPRQGGAK